MNKELNDAMNARETAAQELMDAAHTLTRAFADFTAASESALKSIAHIAVSAGERERTRSLNQWTSPAATDREMNTRRHMGTSAGSSAQGAIEHQLCQAFGNGLSAGGIGATLGLELSTEAGAFLRAAAEVASQRAPQTQPDVRFVSIISAQSQRLRELSLRFT